MTKPVFVAGLAAFAAVAAVAMAAAPPAAAQTPVCNSLGGKHKAAAAKLLATLRPYECCTDTVAACLAAKPRCSVAVRLADDVCRQVKLERTPEEITAAIASRAASMTAAPLPASAFALDESTRAGDPKAPVTVVLYACTRCPYCKMLTGPLHREVTEGELRGKVKLYFRPFPLRDHAGATEGGLALMAAAKMGRFWPYALHVFAHFDEFAPKALAGWAAALGMDRATFEKTVADAATREALVASKREGLRNKVTATPTLFIDGRKYVYDMSLGSLVDVLSEEHERAQRR